MKIAFCHHYSISFNSGGEQIILSAAELLRESGHRVEIHSLPLRRRGAYNKNILKKVDYREGIVHKVDADVAYFTYAPAVWSLFRANCPKIAGIHNFLLYPEKAAPELLNKDFLSILKSQGPMFSLAYYYSRLIKDRELMHFDAVHVVNPALGGSVTSKRTFFVPNWIDTDIFKPRFPKEDVFSILFVGRPSWTKGFDLYVEVCKKLKDMGYKFNCLATSESIGPVRGLGFIANRMELAEAYSKAHVVVYPSRADVFGLVIVEAMACGTPVITTPLPTHKSLGLPIIQASTPAGILKAILNLHRLWSRDEEAYLGLCSRSSERAMKYDKRLVFPKFLKMLESVANLSSN